MDFARQVVLLEKQINKITESYDKGWKLLEAKIGEDNARRDAEFTKRDIVNTRWQIGVLLLQWQ